MSDATITKLPAPAETKEFDPTKAERIAILALNQEMNRIRAEADQLFAEVSARLGLDNTFALSYNPQTNKIEAVKRSAQA